MDGTVNRAMLTATDDISLYIDHYRMGHAIHDAALQHKLYISTSDQWLRMPSADCSPLQAALDSFAASHIPKHEVRSPEPLQRRFEVMAYTTPCATAVAAGGRQLRYGELDAQADALALHLQRLGLQPGSFCLIDLAPSLAQIRAVLAVLKAGGACLHMDAGITAGAAAAAMAMVQPVLRLTQRAPRHDVPLPFICCEDDAPELPFGWPDEAPVGWNTPACVHAAMSASGGLCIVVRTHYSLGAGLELSDGPWLPCAEQVRPADVTFLWQPLSRGALLTIPAHAPN